MSHPHAAPLQLAGAQPVGGRGHIQVRQPGPAESAARHLGNREDDLAQLLTGRGKAPDRRATEARNPEVALLIGGHPIGYPVRALDRDEPSPVADRAGADVVVEDVDSLGGRVDEIHLAAVGAPRDAVRLRYVAGLLARMTSPVPRGKAPRNAARSQTPLSRRTAARRGRTSHRSSGCRGCHAPPAPSARSPPRYRRPRRYRRVPQAQARHRAGEQPRLPPARQRRTPAFAPDWS